MKWLIIPFLVITSYGITENMENMEIKWLGLSMLFGLIYSIIIEIARKVEQNEYERRCL